MPDTDVDTSGGEGDTKPPLSKAAVEVDDERLSKIVKSVIAEELKPIKGDIGGLYSRQDKQQNAFSDFLKEFNKGKASGLSDQDAQTQAESALQDRATQQKREKAIDLVLERFANDSSAPPAGTSPGGTDETSQVFAKYKVDMNDPAAVGFLTLKGAELKAAVADFAFAKSQKTSPDPSTAAALIPGAQASGKITETVADAKYAELNKLYKNPTSNAAKIKQLKKELTDGGYEI